jgi:hypothetical protein
VRFSYSSAFFRLDFTVRPAAFWMMQAAFFADLHHLLLFFYE